MQKDTINEYLKLQAFLYQKNMIVLQGRYVMMFQEYDGVVVYIISMRQESDNYIIETVFDRGNATYKQQETVTGNITLVHKTQPTFRVDVASLIITPIGKMTLNNRQNNKRIEQAMKSVKQVKILKCEPIELAKNKTLSESSKLSFRFKLSKGEYKYVETYVGVYISITYEIDIQFKVLNSAGSHVQQVPFYIQVPKQGRQTITDFVYPKKKSFMIRSEDIKGDRVPKFKIRGQLQSQICYFAEDLNGFIVIDQAESKIRSIDVQMYRVQKIITTQEKIVERTQIQMIQMCDGDVTRNLQLPIYMILPRYYSCPSLCYLWCELDFQVDLLIVFRDGFKVTVNIPLKLIRS